MSDEIKNENVDDDFDVNDDFFDDLGDGIFADDETTEGDDIAENDPPFFDDGELSDFNPVDEDELDGDPFGDGYTSEDFADDDDFDSDDDDFDFDESGDAE